MYQFGEDDGPPEQDANGRWVIQLSLFLHFTAEIKIVSPTADEAIEEAYRRKHEFDLIDDRPYSITDDLEITDASPPRWQIVHERPDGR